MLDKLKTALVLVVIGALSGIIIFGVNEATAQDIIDNREERELDYFKEIFDLDPDALITTDII